LKVSKRQLTSFAGASLAYLLASFSESYFTLYIAMVVIIAFPMIAVREPSTRVLYSFLLVYFGFALLNISDYRNYISIETLRMYVTSLYAFTIPVVALTAVPRTHVTQIRSTPVIRYMLMGHLVAVWLAVAYVYARYGMVLVKQDLRFSIPTALGYAIRSAVFVPVCFVMFKDYERKRMQLVLISILSVLPPIMIASRSTTALGLLAVCLYMALSRLYGWGAAIKARRRWGIKVYALAALAVIGCYSVIAGGFYVRRANTDQLMSGEEFVSGYLNAYPKFLMYAVAPLYQGFNETAALTSRIVDQNIRNTATSTPLVFADFENLLGLSNVSAAQHFGDSVGRAQDGGLTPGLLGALLLDYRDGYFIAFFGLGLILALLRHKGMGSKRWLCVYVVCMLQIIHLFQRGFVKPEYFTTLIIISIYLMFSRVNKAEDESNIS